MRNKLNVPTLTALPITMFIVGIAICISAQDVLADENSATIIPMHGEEFLQPIHRNDRKFAELWKTLHDCEPLPIVKNGQIPSDYLRRRGYTAADPEGKGYVSISVDERLYGMRATELLLPTTWSILSITVNAPVETVKIKLEKAQGFKFSPAGHRHYKRKLNFKRNFGSDAAFEILPDKKNPNSTIISCDLDQQ